MSWLVIPDDYPPVMSTSEAFRKIKGRTGVVLYTSKPASSEDLLKRIREAEVVLNIRSHSKFTREVLEQCTRLRLLSVWGTGTDNIDLAAARDLGITVTNTPGVSAISVAEHTLALMLAVARKIPQTDWQVREGQWPKGIGTQLHGKVLGLLGLGAIGRQMAYLGRGIGMKVIAWTFHPSQSLAEELGVQLVSAKEVFQQADVVTIHLRQSHDTLSFVGEAELALMKPTAILVNTARGPIIRESALIRSLQEGKIAGAGLDVFDSEPLSADHPLFKLPNTVLTPHSAGVTPEVLEAGLSLSIENVFNFQNSRPIHVVVTGKR